MDGQGSVATAGAGGSVATAGAGGSVVRASFRCLFVEVSYIEGLGVYRDVSSPSPLKRKFVGISVRMRLRLWGAKGVLILTNQELR